MTTETTESTENVRQQRGLILAATSNIQKKDADSWVVPSQTLRGKYTVRMAKLGKSCTCPDFELRQKPCKHVYAVEYVERRETAPDGTVIETRAARVTYRQDWPAYNAAQTTEKETFCHLLHDLCQTVASPAPTRGRPRVLLSDAIFSAAFKVYSTVSARRFMTDLRDARARGQVTKTLHYNSIFKAIESEKLTPILHNLITASALPLQEVEADFAVDSTGFGTSQFFRYYSMKYEHDQIGRNWIKAHAMVGAKTNIVTAVRISDRYENDSPFFAPLVQQTALDFSMREVSADKAYNSKLNMTLVAAKGAEPYIAFRANARGDSHAPVWNRMYHYFCLNREDFLAHYHKRSNVEATFSMIKRVFGERVRSRTKTAQQNEVLLKVLCHNIRVLVHEMHELGIAPMFKAAEGAAAQ